MSSRHRPGPIQRPLRRCRPTEGRWHRWPKNRSGFSFFEYAVLAVEGSLTVAGATAEPGAMLYLGNGRPALTLTSARGAHAVLLGGEPFAESLVMW